MKLRSMFMISGSLAALSFVFLSSSVDAISMHKPSHKTNPIPTGPTINILLEKDAASAFLEAKGSYRVLRRDNGSRLSSGKNGKRFVIHAIQDGLRWGEEYPDIYQIAVVPTSPDTHFLVNGIQYRGILSIYHVRNNHIAIVNEIPIEEFVTSTLAIKYEEPLAKEAMAALAISARTEAYHKMLQGKNVVRPWDVTASEVGYFGNGSNHNRNDVEEAVEWTRFMVLESTKQEGPLEHAFISPEKAVELADKGYDAQKILKSAFPHAKIGATISADELTVR